MNRSPLILWIGLLASGGATLYAAGSVVFYVWMNAAAPDRWPSERAGLWASGAVVLFVLFLALFVYCLVSLIRRANRKV
jgi:hypothetical protein